MPITFSTFAVNWLKSHLGQKANSVNHKPYVFHVQHGGLLTHLQIK
jgi:hypothetical protein